MTTDDATGSLPPPPPRPPAPTPPPPPAAKTGWRRIPTAAYVIGAVLVVFGVLVVVALIINDQKRWSDLANGDCFDFPGGETFIHVNIRDCDEPHDAQVVARIVVARSLDDPAESFEAADEILLQCEEAVLRKDLNFNGSPEDILLNYISPGAPDWDAGERSIVCLIESEVGLLRSLFRN